MIILKILGVIVVIAFVVIFLKYLFEFLDPSMDDGEY
jgi:hypothetical protein